jgi:hypothetical protein
VKSINKRIVVQTSTGKKSETLISKISRAKISENMAQVVEHLPRKYEILSSKPNN